MGGGIIFSIPCFVFLYLEDEGEDRERDQVKENKQQRGERGEEEGREGREEGGERKPLLSSSQ